MIFVRPSNHFMYPFHAEPFMLRGSCRAAACGDKRKSNIVYESRRAEVSEQETQYVINMDLPGVKKNDVYIDVDSNKLRVKAERKSGEEVTARFRQFFAFDKKTVNIADLQAELDEGVLTITLPKKEKAAKIDVDVSLEDVPEEKEKESSVRLTVDLPGVKADNVKVEFNDEVLSIDAQRKKGGSHYTVCRSARLDQDRINTDTFRAYLADGVLTVLVDRKEPAVSETSEKRSFLVAGATRSLEAPADATSEKEQEVAVETVDAEDEAADGKDDKEWEKVEDKKSE